MNCSNCGAGGRRGATGDGGNRRSVHGSGTSGSLREERDTADQPGNHGGVTAGRAALFLNKKGQE